MRKRRAEIGVAAILEVHDRERDLAHDVDPAHRLVELDAVENDQLAVDARDVSQMQIAVALAHEAFLAPAQECLAARGVLALGPGGQRLDLVVLAGADSSGRNCAKFCRAWRSTSSGAPKADCAPATAIAP